MRVVIFALSLTILSSGCEREWDTEVVGYVEVNVTTSPDISSAEVDEPRWASSMIIRIVNGDQKTRLFYDEKTRFVDTEKSSKVSWDFDRIYRVRGKKNWVDPEISREGEIRIYAVPDTTQKLWAFRIERLSEQESQSLIDAGEVVPRNSSTNPRVSEGESNKPSVPESEREAKAALLRELADVVKEQIQAIEIGKSGLTGDSGESKDQETSSHVDDELVTLHTRLEDLKAQILELENGSNSPD